MGQLSTLPGCNAASGPERIQPLASGFICRMKMDCLDNVLQHTSIKLSYNVITNGYSTHLMLLEVHCHL